jgi:Nuclease-related domain
VRDWLYPYYCGAGRGARDKYNKASRRWRKRVFPRLRLVFAGVAVMLVVAARADDFRLSSWLFGLALGALLALYTAVRESPPPYIENWRTGSDGEQRTARALAPLRRDGLVLFHDLPDRRERERSCKGNIDHIVVSPAGVFLLDTKYLGGEVSVDADVLHVRMLDDDQEFYDSRKLANTMRGRAVRLKEDIEQTGIGNVQAVVVFWNPFPTGLARGHRVIYVHGPRLAGWLREQRPVMTPHEVVKVADAILHARPPERRTWWERLATLGPRRR